MSRLLGITAESDLPMLSGLTRRLRTKLRRVGATALVALGFLAELGWAFFGSMGLELGARPAVANETTALLWVAGAIVLAALTAFAAWLAASEEKHPD